MKMCTKCKVEKPYELFHKNPKTKSGRASQCKACQHAQTKESRNSQSPEDKQRWAEYRWRAHLKSRYGITPDEYFALLKKQNGHCAICATDKCGGRGKNSRLAVDHDHKTGKVRGLLCTNCNNGLGRFQDSIELLNSAVAYLTR